MKNNRSSTTEHIAWLDGTRGFAALWVFLAHVQFLSGMKEIPIMSWGGLAVDLFMLLSGFLMSFHYQLRREAEPWNAPKTWACFWTRRFFRIAPVYYILLICAVLLAPWLAHHREVISSIWPSAETPTVRYSDSSLTNLVMHFTFLFGAFPEYCFRTALPD